MNIGLKQKIKTAKGILLYFKNDNCPPCMALRPKVQRLINDKFNKMDFEIIDTVEQPELSNEFQVFANPTILVFFEGKEYIRKSKYVSILELEKDINRLYKLVM
ncbi:MAG TPA: thioredoxin [Crocinitomix sp.]|nr:thioredoxin [Crocinitomix sp.]